MLLKSIITDGDTSTFFTFVFIALMAQDVRKGMMEMKGQRSCYSTGYLKESFREIVQFFQAS